MQIIKQDSNSTRKSGYKFESNTYKEFQIVPGPDQLLIVAAV